MEKKNEKGLLPLFGVVLGIVVLGLAYWLFAPQELGGRTFEVTHNMFNATSSASWATEYRVDDYRNAVLLFSCTSSPTMTVKFAASNLTPDEVDFTQAASASNHWDYVQVVDLEDGTSIDGDTGVSCTGSADVRNFEVNTELITTLSAQVSSYTAGTTTLKLKYGTNQ